MGRMWEDSKRFLLHSLAILTRAQLDRAVGRDGFYTNTIAPLLNSMSSVAYKPSSRPSKCMRECGAGLILELSPTHAHMDRNAVAVYHCLCKLVGISAK
jgi:hypothetical protein